MAIKEVNGEFYSTLTGHSYTSLLAAQHYENLEKRRSKTATEGEKVLDSLSTEQLKSLAIAFSARIDEQQNKGISEAQHGEWLEGHPELFSNGQDATINGTALRTYLLSQGKTPPFSKYDLDLAYSSLEDAGALNVDNSKKKKVETTTEQPSEYTGLDAWKNSTYRFRSGW